MARTVEDVARELIATIDSDAGYLLGCQWLVKRYGQLATRTKLRHLRQVGQLSVPAQISSGTATATRGHRRVTLDSTAQAACSNTVVGWHLRMRTTWYEVVAYGGTYLDLKDTYEEDTSTDGSYRLVQRWVPLDPAADYIGDNFIHPRLRRALKLRDYSVLDRLDPSRQTISGGPSVVVEAPPTETGRKRVEFYPYSTTSENYFYLYWRGVDELKPADYLPPYVKPWALIEGALIDLMRFKAAKCADSKDLEGAAYWRNEMRTQETKWERYIVDLIGADRGEDDTTVLLQAAQMDGMNIQDITTATDHILANWSGLS